MIEVLLAVSLSAFLLATVYWTYFSINRSIETAGEGQESYETGRILLDLVKKDVRGGIVSGKYPLAGRTETFEGSIFGDVSFVTTARLGTGPLTLRKVQYALIRDEKGEKIFVRRESTDLKGAMEKASLAELSRRVTSFDLSFYDGKIWRDQWEGGAKEPCPKQIRVTFDVVEGKNSIRRFRAEESVASAN